MDRGVSVKYLGVDRGVQAEDDAMYLQYEQEIEELNNELNQTKLDNKTL